MYSAHKLRHLDSDINRSGIKPENEMSFQMKQSLAQRFLPEELWVWLSARTSYGTTIYECIKSGIENPDSKVGLYAPGSTPAILKVSFEFKFFKLRMFFYRS